MNAYPSRRTHGFCGASVSRPRVSISTMSASQRASRRDPEQSLKGDSGALTMTPTRAKTVSFWLSEGYSGSEVKCASRFRPDKTDLGPNSRQQRGTCVTLGGIFAS